MDKLRRSLYRKKKNVIKDAYCFLDINDIVANKEQPRTHFEDENVYVLKEGVVKVSVLMRDGREFNITYLKGFDILSMFKDAVVDCKFSSLMIRVESDEASFYCVSKELFNQLLNEHSELVEYVNTYYRKKLSETISRQELMTMNGKNGAVCAFTNNRHFVL